MQESKNNRMFKENEGMFHRKANIEKERKGKVPEMDKFVQFWAGIWEDETSTPHSRWMRRGAEKVRAKATSVDELTINEKKLYADIVFKEGNMVRGERLTVLEERMKALDPNQKYISFLDANRPTKLRIKG